MNDEVGPILLVDGRNLLYRAIFANKNSKGKSPLNVHHFTVMTRFMYQWLDRFRPTSVNIFWDAPKAEVWRRKVFPAYKDRDNKDIHIDIREDLVYTQAAAKDIFTHMGVRQFFRNGMEADDLIYAAARVLFPHSTTIVSSDQDFLQVVYRMNNVRLYDPMKDKFIASIDFDPVIQKALAGDTSDKIDGYFKIGPVRGEKLARSVVDRESFLAERGRTTFIRNLLLVDLAYCPDLLKNELYVQRVLSTSPEFDKGKIYDASKKHRISGLIGEYQRNILPFKMMVDRDGK